MTAIVGFWLSVLAYGSTGVAAALSVAQLDRPWLATATFAWFVGAWWLVWRGAHGQPRVPQSVRRVVDVAAVGVVAYLGVRAWSDWDDGGSKWPVLAPAALVLLQALRALVVTTPAEAETFLAGGFALAVWASTGTSWERGSLWLAGFAWIWLTAMTLSQLLRDSARGETSGTVLSEGEGVWASVRSGLMLSSVTVGLGIGGFLLVLSPVSSPANHRGERGASTRAPGVPGWRDEPRLLYEWQSGPQPSEAVLYRVRGPRDVSRFRVAAYDFRGADGWSRSEDTHDEIPWRYRMELPETLGLLFSGTPPGREVTLTVTVGEAVSGAVLTAGLPLAIAGPFPGPLIRDPDAGLRTRLPLAADMAYTLTEWEPAWTGVNLWIHGAASADAVPPRYLRITPSLAPEAAARAEQWGSGAPDTWRRVQYVAGSLGAAREYQFDYAWAPPGREPIEWFVTSAERGNCLNFASALVLLLRQLAIPARLVTGYLGHQWDPGKQEWALSAADAHAWCEVAIDGVGWIPVDGTPPARWAGRPVGGPTTVVSEAPSPSPGEGMMARAGSASLGLAAAGRSLRQASWRAWPWVVLAWAVGWIALTGWQMFRGASAGARSWWVRRGLGPVQRAYLSVVDAAARHGHKTSECWTPSEFTKFLVSRLPAVESDMRRFGELVTTAGFGPARPSIGVVLEARSLARRLRAAVKR